LDPEIQKPKPRPQNLDDFEEEIIEEEEIPANIRADDFLGQVTGVLTPGFDRAAILEEALQRIVKLGHYAHFTDKDARIRMRIVAERALSR
jgi:hypothetical protein